jgi:hypothetical protein
LRDWQVPRNRLTNPLFESLAMKRQILANPWPVKIARDPKMPVDRTPAIFVQQCIGFGHTINMRDQPRRRSPKSALQNPQAETLLSL